MPHSAVERLWPTDRQGRILNRARSAIAPEDLLELCHDVTDLALERFGTRLHSVYLTGDAAWHWPGPAKFRIILRDERPGHTDLDFGILRALDIRAAHMLRHPVEVRVHGWRDVESPAGDRPSRLMLRLATNARCLAGPDLAAGVGPLVPDRRLAACLIEEYPEIMGRIEAQAPHIVNETRLRRLSRLAGLRTLEACFALVIDREETYTECPDVMAGFAALHWPHRRHSISTAERLARDGVGLSLELSSFIDHHTRWVNDAVRERLAAA